METDAYISTYFCGVFADMITNMKTGCNVWFARIWENDEKINTCRIMKRTENLEIKVVLV